MRATIGLALVIAGLAALYFAFSSSTAPASSGGGGAAPTP